ncbi:MAG: nitrous oxide reductase accessory protein NosL [Desulfomonile tiedjei]|nr:nitrous oxide reductase accessory protein NosL [Desulfomonile tiedjei]
MTRIAKNALSFVGVLMLVPMIAWAADVVDLPNGSKLDLSQICPVCNMNLKGGELGPAAVVFDDGKVVGFDGPGDLFRYLLDPSKYGFDAAKIKEAYVTDHETKKFIDAKKAYFVTGTTLTGGMGSEVIPFGSKEAAEKFKTDHHGKSVAAYAGVKAEDVKSQKKMLKIKREGTGSGHGH